MASDGLHRRVILVTRPRAQAAGLARLIERSGGRAEIFPAIEIVDLPPPAALERLEEFDLAIFISPTAAAKAAACVRKWPRQLRVAAIGAGTRRELERHGLRQVLVPSEGADSEALLNRPELARVDGKRIVIIRGEGGRALLGDTLASRGARVEYAECYRRARPSQKWSGGKVDAVTVSSGEALANLFELMDPESLRATPLFVPHERIAELARSRSVAKVLLAAGPSDEEMLARLVAYFHG